MPRQDVPYGGTICRLKERIAEIWDKLDQKLHSINGVEGDGAGNVEIVSGDAAIMVSESPTGHFIEIGLDHGNLPSAAVSSVNGQTGAVRLDAKDILSDGDSNVQSDVDENKAAINDCFNSITSEQLARQAADNVLQGNINTVQASIPEAAAAAVSNDPTVAQLAADVPGKLDKISSGSTLKAYTHTGQSQGETAIVNGVDANSIGLRDGNGRMQAADPAAGATDKTLVTANWVSQTGDTSPNNLIHRSGNETSTGNKYIYTLYSIGMQSLTGNQYNSIMELGATGTGGNVVFSISGRYGFAIGGIAYDGNGNPTFKGTSYFTTGNRTTLGIGIKDGVMYLCGRRTSSPGQSPVIQIFSHTRGTVAPTVKPGVTNPVVEMDSYIEAFQF